MTHIVQTVQTMPQRGFGLAGAGQVWEEPLIEEPKGLGSPQHIEIVVYIEILKARLGPSPFVSLGDLQQATGLSNLMLERTLDNLETHGRIESVRVDDEELYYFAVF